MLGLPTVPLHDDFAALRYLNPFHRRAPQTCMKENKSRLVSWILLPLPPPPRFELSNFQTHGFLKPEYCKVIYIRKSKPSFPSSKITSTEEILNGKLIFFCSAFYCHWREFLSKVTFLTCKLRYFSKNLKSDWISMISQVNGISELELYKPQESWQIYTKNLEN